MRFEVKGGGIAAILFAMTLLSGAVFVLGLLAGYDVGRQAQIDTAQLATSYSLQSPPASPASSNQSAAESGNSTMQTASNSVSPAAGKSGSPMVASADNGITPRSNSPTQSPPQASENPPRKGFVAASIPPTMQPGRTRLPTARDAASTENPEAVDEPSEAPGDTGRENGRRVASSAQPLRHRPYNIQIEAAMDISGADQMIARLQKLGYTSHLVPTEIDGQRWYKVEVGPYATAQEASAAEAQLRDRYDATYGGVARRNPAAQNSENEDSEE